MTKSRQNQRQTINVVDYGAVGDNRTDNTGIFSSCLKDLINAGGGRMFLPVGVYHGRMIIPPVPRAIPGWITVEIDGEGEPTPVFGTIGSIPMPEDGTIIRCLDRSGPAAISASRPNDPLYQSFSAVNLVVRNLEVRTNDDPGIGGIDLGYALQCKLENVCINTGIYNVRASRPTHSTCGLVTPECNNAAMTVLRNVVVTGYHSGIVVNEHTDGDNIVVASNVHGLVFNQAHHGSYFARVSAYRNSNSVTVKGRHGFSIQQLNIERPGPGQTDELNTWQSAESDINDPDNLGTGDINYWVVVGNVGATDVFTRIGGASIRARRIGTF